MSNMSYCRFQNTSKDLNDCLKGIDEMLDEGEGLSDDELEAFEYLARTCWQVMLRLEEYGELDILKLCDRPHEAKAAIIAAVQEIQRLAEES